MKRADTRRAVPPGLVLPALLLIATAMCRRESPPHIVVLGPEQPLAKSATDAVDRFHAELSRGQYADLCEASESHAFSGSSNLPCPLFLAYVHDHLGNVVETKRTQLPVAEDRRAGEPVRVGLEYATHYERGEAREHFEWRIDRVQTILIGYRVESDVLSR